MLSGVADKKGLCLSSSTQSNLEKFLAHGFQILLWMYQVLSQQNTAHPITKTWRKSCWIKYRNFWKTLKNKTFIKPVYFTTGHSLQEGLWYLLNTKQTHYINHFKASHHICMLVKCILMVCMDSAEQWHHLSSTGIRIAQATDLEWKRNIRDCATLRKQQDCPIWSRGRVWLLRSLP